MTVSYNTKILLLSRTTRRGRQGEHGCCESIHYLRIYHTLNFEKKTVIYLSSTSHQISSSFALSLSISTYLPESKVNQELVQVEGDGDAADVSGEILCVNLSQEDLVKEESGGDCPAAVCVDLEQEDMLAKKESEGPAHVDTISVQDTELKDVSVVANVTQEAKPVEKHDPYFYTNQDHFTSEIFKIELRRLPKFYGLGELKKLINTTLQLDSNKVKPTSGISKTSVFVCFRSEASKQSGLNILNGYKWKGSVLEAIEAKPAKDPLMLKRKKDAVQNQGKKQAKLDDESQILMYVKKLKDVTTPYWIHSYEEQIKMKTTYVRNVMHAYANHLSNGYLGQWIDHQKSLNNGLICPVEPFRTVKNTTGYRNRCEFTIGLHPVTKERVIGFRIGAYAKGDCSVLPVDECLHVSDVAKQCARVFQEFVVSSELEPHDPINRKGHFKTLAVRNTTTGQVMVTLDVCTTGLSQEQITKLRADYKDFFVSGPGQVLGVNSLNFRELDVQTKKGDNFRPVDHIHGEEFIIEKLLGYEFQISPASFFQINTAGAEILYSTIAELANPNDKTTVLDICCGTGTIGISMAKKAGQVLGVEIIKAAVENAKQNAIHNGVAGTCDFFTGDAQDALQPTIVRAKYDNIVAILDPPRPGLGNSVLNMIRATWKIKRLVFVACNFNASFQNLVHLAKKASKTTPGDPFVPIRVIPIDMFPHSKQCEVVILLERRSVASLEVPTSIPVKVPEGKGASTKKLPKNKQVQQQQQFKQPPQHFNESSELHDEPEDVEFLEEVGYDDGYFDNYEEADDVDYEEAEAYARQVAYEEAEEYAYEEPQVNYRRVMPPNFKMPSIAMLKKTNPLASKATLRIKKYKLKKKAMEEWQQSQNIQLSKKGNSKSPWQTPFQPGRSGAANIPWGNTKKGANFAGPSNSQRGRHPNPFGQNQRMPSPFTPMADQFVAPQQPMQQFAPVSPFTLQGVQQQAAPLQMPPRPVFREMSSQTDCKEFMSANELDEAERLGLKWGSRVSDGALHDYRKMQKEEEEAVQRFREGFLSALRLKQKKLFSEIARSGPRKETWEDNRLFTRRESSRSTSSPPRRDWYDANWKKNDSSAERSSQGWNRDDWKNNDSSAERSSQGWNRDDWKNNDSSAEQSSRGWSNDDWKNNDSSAEQSSQDWYNERYERRRESSSHYGSGPLRKPAALQVYSEELWSHSVSSQTPAAPIIGDQRDKYYSSIASASKSSDNYTYTAPQTDFANTPAMTQWSSNQSWNSRRTIN
ncbi:Hypothetical predicted protein [Cloeon dipterum]|uniref:tRNA (uracil(54)-C(5))-methyltransferase n=1 Tax=Cloeon dipterum TaxID=197152 RepID=A0A8S1C3X8_9INSE|nr:Hypothetical predicted protein [Cloeon dipterum]